MLIHKLRRELKHSGNTFFLANTHAHAVAWKCPRNRSMLGEELRKICCEIAELQPNKIALRVRNIESELPKLFRERIPLKRYHGDAFEKFCLSHRLK
jgi:hypothetical protein